MMDKLLAKFWRDFVGMDEMGTKHMVQGCKVAIVFSIVFGSIVFGVVITPIVYVLFKLLSNNQ